LVTRTSPVAVGDTYRRDFSGANTENKVAELLCEITLVDAIGGVSPVAPVFRPATPIGTECDFKVVVNGYDLYGESKRFEDAWTGGKRSIEKSPPGSTMPRAKRPRAMDLYSKLREVPRQFPMNTLNVLFLFQPSLGNAPVYIRQALYGDASWSNELDNVVLHDDGLYALSDWRAISACAHCQVKCDGSLFIGKIWRNPMAKVPVPNIVSDRLAVAR